MLNTLQEMSDEKLMELYQIGDLYAFNVLYQRYEHKIYGYFHRFFPEERCADLLQETFLKVHRSRSRYKTSLPFSKWLFVIACNLAKDEFKRLSRLKEYLDDGQLENMQTFLVDPETPESIVEHDELWERIQQAILDLPENHREAIIQSKYDGKSYPEIAESMDITVGAVKQRVYRGLLTLREKLKDLVEPEFKEKAKKGFSGIMIFKFQGIIKKVLMGGLEAMKISVKVKIVMIGVAVVLILGGVSIFLFRDKTTLDANLSAENTINATSSNNADQNKKELNVSKKDIVEAMAFLDKLDKTNEYGKNSKENESLSEMAGDTIKTDKINESAIKDEKANISKRTPEQQHKYEILEQYIPRHFELNAWFNEVDQAENTKPPEGLSESEIGRWFQQRDIENEKKYPGSLKRQRYSEQIKVDETLIDSFPGIINGATFTSPGFGTYRLIREIKFRELRDIVGGTLPVKLGNN